MSISLNIDTYMLCNLFNINTAKLNKEYLGMSISEIMEAEAKAGNAKAKNFDITVLNDPVKLIELFQLKDPANKFAILSNMGEGDLENLLPLLPQDDLLQGLQYFSKDGLLGLIEEMPQDEMLNYTFELFSDAHIMQMMPEEQMNKMLMSTDIDKQQEIKFLQTVHPKALATMIEKTTGEPALGVGKTGMDGKTQYNMPMLVGQIASMDSDNFNRAILNMPKENKRSYVYKLAAQNPNLYKSVSTNTYIEMMDQKKDKQAMLRATNVIEPDRLVKMIAKLPKDLTAAVLTQMDTDKFASVLLAKFKNVIGEMIK